MFTLDLVTKDLGLAVDLGRETGTPMEVSALVEQLHRRGALRCTATRPASWPW
ncbi:MAG: NAD-binding protein [Chloroflexota bacterium]